MKQGVKDVGVALGAAAVYAAALLDLISWLVRSDVPMFTEGWVGVPTGWWLLVQFAYFAVPLILAGALSWVRRGGVQIFLLTAGVIFGLHFVYSFVIFSWRMDYIRERRITADQSRRGTVALSGFTQEMDDIKGEDGLVDQIVLRGRFRPQGLPPGRYELDPELTQGLKVDRRLDVAAWTIDSFVDDQDRPLILTVDAASLKESFSKGALALNLTLYLDLPVDKRGEEILSLARWAAFFLPGLPGREVDGEIYHDRVELKQFRNVQTLALDPARIQRPQVIFQRYLGDTLVDADGDGLAEALRVSLELDSIYTGPVYVQAQLTGVPGFFQAETAITPGIVQLDVDLDGQQLADAGVDGPYELSNIVLFNNSAYCPGGRCENKNKPVWSVYPGVYTTAAYKARQFE